MNFGMNFTPIGDYQVVDLNAAYLIINGTIQRMAELNPYGNKFPISAINRFGYEYMDDIECTWYSE